jgi:hypothetical protein
MRAVAALAAAFAFAGAIAPAHAAEGDVDLAAEFARTCFASGTGLEARTDALLARGADTDPNGKPGGSRMFAYDVGDALVIALLEPRICIVASSFVDVDAVKQAFPALVRAHARGEPRRIDDLAELGALREGEFLGAYRAGDGGDDEWVLMTGRTFDGRPLVSIGLRESEVPELPPERVR